MTIQLTTAKEVRTWLKGDGKSTYHALMEKLFYPLMDIDVEMHGNNIAIKFIFMAGREAGPVLIGLPITGDEMKGALHMIANRIKAERLPPITGKGWDSKRGRRKKKGDGNEVLDH